MEKRVIQASLVLKDLQGHQEDLVLWGPLVSKGQRVIWSYQERKDKKEKEDWMGPQDFWGHVDKMVGMDVLEKEGILGLEGTIRMQPPVREGFLDCQALQGKQDPRGLQDWDFQAHQEREAYQESPGAQE